MTISTGAKDRMLAEKRAVMTAPPWAVVKPPPLTCTTRLRLDVCGQPAKRSYLGALCALHFPAGVIA